MTTVIIRTDVNFERPRASALAALFEEAELEFEASAGVPPATCEDWNQVVRAYTAKMYRTRSAESAVIRYVLPPRRLPRPGRATRLQEERP